MDSLYRNSTENLETFLYGSNGRKPSRVYGTPSEVAFTMLLGFETVTLDDVIDADENVQGGILRYLIQYPRFDLLMRRLYVVEPTMDMSIEDISHVERLRWIGPGQIRVNINPCEVFKCSVGPYYIRPRSTRVDAFYVIIEMVDTRVVNPDNLVKAFERFDIYQNTEWLDPSIKIFTKIHRYYGVHVLIRVLDTARKCHVKINDEDGLSQLSIDMMDFGDFYLEVYPEDRDVYYSERVLCGSIVRARL